MNQNQWKKKKTVRKNHWGRYEDTDTGIVFDSRTKCAYGVQLVTGKTIPLTSKHINICKQNGWPYQIPNREKERNILKNRITQYINKINKRKDGETGDDNDEEEDSEEREDENESDEYQYKENNKVKVHHHLEDDEDNEEYETNDEEEEEQEEEEEEEDGEDGEEEEEEDEEVPIGSFSKNSHRMQLFEEDGSQDNENNENSEDDEEDQEEESNQLRHRHALNRPKGLQKKGNEKKSSFVF